MDDPTGPPPWAGADLIPPDVGPDDRAILARVRPFTMTSVARLLALIDAARHLTRCGVAGAVAECGVWRGGSMMAAALALLGEGDSARDLYLYDTFAGMTPPGEHDADYTGAEAATLLAGPQGEFLRCEAGLEEVRRNLGSTGYPAARTHFVEGPVERTLPGNSPGPLALLRVDTDWYGPTRHCLEQLYPLLAPGGVLILDDHGHWQGARRAAEEYFARLPHPPLLTRIDYTARLAVKPGPG